MTRGGFAIAMVWAGCACGKRHGGAIWRLRRRRRRHLAAYDWSGFYAGGSSSAMPGRLRIGRRRRTYPARWICFKASTPSKTTGSFFQGLQAGYNYMLPNRFVVGAEVDTTFPAIQNPPGSPSAARRPFLADTKPETYSETTLSSGTMRGRIGYAPSHFLGTSNWLFYATGGFAWTYDQLDVDATREWQDGFMPFLVALRLGWLPPASKCRYAALDCAP